jgi:hypothetical protein
MPVNVVAPDRGRPDFPGIPGFWANVGETGQIHLFGGEQPSPLAKGADQGPASPHLALAVADNPRSQSRARSSRNALSVAHWVTGPQALQLFVRNMIELHQADECRCGAANRRCR